MIKQMLRDPLEDLLVEPAAQQGSLPIADRPPADVEMARVLKTTPRRMASDPPNGAIAYWEHGALHDVVEPMAEHVVITYPAGSQRLERRTGKSVAIGTARPGVVTVIPAGSTSRWDIHQPMNVVQLYLPQATLDRISDEADKVGPGDLLERTAHPDPIRAYMDFHRMSVDRGGVSLRHDLANPTDGRE
jgi:AraC family transcriptional regulator